MKSCAAVEKSREGVRNQPEDVQFGLTPGFGPNVTAKAHLECAATSGHTSCEAAQRLEIAGVHKEGGLQAPSQASRDNPKLIEVEAIS